MLSKKYPSGKDDSGLSIDLRLSSTLLAVIIGAGISFGVGFTVANTNNQKLTQTQNINCPVQNPLFQQQIGVKKH